MFFGLDSLKSNLLGSGVAGEVGLPLSGPALSMVVVLPLVVDRRGFRCLVGA